MTLSIKDLRKSYGPNSVLKGIDMVVQPGEVRALLGPNGAGKSTLIKCLGGAVSYDGGSIRLDDETLPRLTPTTARDHGIVTIHQHPSLISALSVRDNIFLGTEMTRRGVLSRRAETRIADELLERFGIRVRSSETVGGLPIGVKQLIEIAKAWHGTDVQVLILDEPTASLSGAETDRLFDEVEKMRAMGTRIIYTTHRLAEVFRIADHITVVADGRVGLDAPTGTVQPAEVIRVISPNATVDHARRPANAASSAPGAPAARVEELAGPRFGPVSFDIAPGEVLGLFGSVGSGRTSLIETLAGRFQPTSGSLEIDGRSVRVRSPRTAERLGIRLVPSDRTAQALWSSLSAMDNALMPSLTGLGRMGVRRFRAERAAFRSIVDQMDLRPPSATLPASDFSGGNQQKIVVGRLSTRSKGARLMIFDEPTQGVDIGARQQIYEAIRQMADDTGCAVLLASSEAEEILAMCDRSLVMDAGRVVDDLRGEDLTEHELLSSAHQFVGSERNS